MSGEEWFSTDFGKGLSPICKSSNVETFVDAEEYYADLRKEIEQTSSGDIICWIGFDGGGATPMPSTVGNEAIKQCPPRNPHGNDKTWFDLLKEASDNRNVTIRVLLNLHPSPRPPDKYKFANFDLVTRLNTLKNCNAINDFRYLFMNGTHHQKLVLVYNSNKGLMAYTGTCDVESGRITNKWCEVQNKIMGDAAAQLYLIFQRRYSEHTQLFQRVGSHKSYLKDVNQLKTTAPQSGNFLMQIATTYGNPNRINPFYPLLPRYSCPPNQVVNGPHRIEISSESIGLLGQMLSPHVLTMIGNEFFIEREPTAKQLIEDGIKQSRTYSFAPNGHTGIYYMIKKGIENAKKFIYMEDQYLVCDEKMGNLDSILTLLVNKVKESSFKKLILFTTRIDDINDEFQGTGWKHRKNFISTLLNVARDKVEICQYKSKGSVGCGGTNTSSTFYIHSKTWIFDDEYLITGSANCNRRGYSHDSELNVGIYDQNKFFVKELRKKIWQKRLNVIGINRSPIQLNELDDFLSAAKFWEQGSSDIMPIENSKKTSFDPSRFPDLDIQSYKAKVTGQTGWKTDWNIFLDKLKIDTMWNLAVDPDGT